MTEPTETPEPDDVEATEETGRLLRALLRQDPLEVDPARREAAIRAALDAAPHGHRTSGTHGAGPARRHRSTRADRGPGALRPVFVAAAVIAVAAVGGMALVDRTGSGDDQAASAGTSAADAAVDEASEPFAAGAPDQLDVGTPGGFDQGAARESEESRALPSAAAVVDLGSYPSLEELLTDAEDLLVSGKAAADGSVQFERSTELGPPAVCEAELAVQGWPILAVASLQDRAVVVAADPASGQSVVLDGAGCAELGRR
jgi:hypothetical protein